MPRVAVVRVYAVFRVQRSGHFIGKGIAGHAIKGVEVRVPRVGKAFGRLWIAERSVSIGQIS